MPQAEKILSDCLRILIRWFIGLNGMDETIDALKKEIAKLSGSNTDQSTVAILD